MAGGLTGLLDDVAASAKLAATSIDDVGAAAGRASTKVALVGLSVGLLVMYAVQRMPFFTSDEPAADAGH